MAILRALDGRFYDLPDDALDQYLIPADQLKAKLSEMARGMQAGAEAGAGGAVTPYAAGPLGGPPQGGPSQPRVITTQAGDGGVVIQIYTYGGQGGGPLGGAPPSGPPPQPEQE
jgi:hypothetical protein